MTSSSHNPSAEAGSGSEGAVDPGAGESVDLSKYVEKAVYDELESKFGSQGNELGELRSFAKDIEPLMEKLEQNPAIVKAVMEGVLDEALATAVVEGKISLKDAKVVTEATNELKSDISQNTDMTPEQIDKLVNDKVTEIVGGQLGSKLDAVTSQIEDLKVTGQMEKAIDEFIAETPDIGDYADAIQAYLDENPWVQNVEVAYHVVKGKAMAEAQGADAEARAIEEAKIAASVGGNGSAGNFQQDSGSAFGQSFNPNLWGR